MMLPSVDPAAAACVWPWCTQHGWTLEPLITLGHLLVIRHTTHIGVSGVEEPRTRCPPVLCAGSSSGGMRRLWAGNR